MLNDSDSDDNNENEGVEDVGYVDCFSWFNNKCANKDAGYRLNKLRMFREDSQMQSLAKSVFDFNMNDEDRFKLLFETEGNLKLIWQFIYLSFFDQDLMMLELKYKQHAEDFQRINAFHQEAGFIAKKEAPKIYRLFKLFCLKDRVFSAFMSRVKCQVPISTGKGEEAKVSSAMEVESDLFLPAYTDTEILMDDMSLSIVEFMSRFEKFKVDEISIDEAKDDICFNAQDMFEGSSCVGLNGLKYTEDENTVEWEKRKEGYNPDTILPTDFQELLKGNSDDLCSLYALHPVNINKETMNIIGSAHIFAEKKQLRQKLTLVLKRWFFHPEVFLLPAQKKKDESTHNLPIEMGFIDKLGEMYQENFA